MKKLKFILTALILLLGAKVEAVAQTFLGPTPYLSFADSPYNGLTFNYFHLEDFEDGALNTPGVSTPNGLVVTSGNVDSVDGDDGNIDGSGINGASLISIPATDTFTFTFDEIVLGFLPTHAGIVWTDVGSATPTIGFDNVIFEAFDPLGTSLGAIGPEPVGDGSFLGETAEDRFFGVINPGGISSIRIMMTNSDDFEIDHLQYGLIPEPSVYTLLVVGFVSVVAYGMRRKKKAQ